MEARTGLRSPAESESEDEALTSTVAETNTVSETDAILENTSTTHRPLTEPTLIHPDPLPEGIVQYHAVNELSNKATQSSIRGREKARSHDLTHLSPDSEVHVVSIGDKPITRRKAIAIGDIVFTSPKTRYLIIEHALRKGDVLAVARVAGIMAVKQTSNLIPLCHNGVAVEGVDVKVEVVGPLEKASKPDESLPVEGRSSEQILELRMQAGIGAVGGVRIQVTVESEGKTGVEMEALTGVAGAALTVIDMCKSVDKGIRIVEISLAKKEGGRSRTWETPRFT